MSIGHELSFSPCLLFDSRAEPVSPDVPWQHAYYDEIRLALFMAVSFIRSQGSQSNQEPRGGGCLKIANTAGRSTEGSFANMQCISFAI